MTLGLPEGLAAASFLLMQGCDGRAVPETLPGKTLRVLSRNALHTHAESSKDPWAP